MITCTDVSALAHARATNMSEGIQAASIIYLIKVWSALSCRGTVPSQADMEKVVWDSVDEAIRQYALVPLARSSGYNVDALAC